MLSKKTFDDKPVSLLWESQEVYGQRTALASHCPPNPTLCERLPYLDRSLCTCLSLFLSLSVSLSVSLSLSASLFLSMALSQPLPLSFCLFLSVSLSFKILYTSINDTSW